MSTLAEVELTGSREGGRIYRGRLTEVKPTANSSFDTSIPSTHTLFLNDRKRTVETAALIVVLVIALALFFDFTNGFHDTANAMATPIATGALKPKTAVLLAAVLNLVGAFLSTEVAKTVSGGIVREDAIREMGAEVFLPLIFAGIRTATVFVVATATIAAVAGGGGLGDIIVNQAGYGLEGVIGAAICVSVLALAADGAVGLLQRALTPAGLRVESRAFEADVTTGVTRRSRPMSKVDEQPG